MTITQFDLLIRAGGPFVLLLVAVLLLRDDRKETAARLFAPLALCLSAFIMTNSSGQALVTGRGEAILNLLAGCAVPFLWWFCLALFDRSFRVQGIVAWIGMAWIVLAATNRGWLGMTLPEPIGNAIAITFGLAVTAHLVWQLLVDQRDDLIDRRRRLRPVIAMLLATQLFIDLLVDVLFGVGWNADWFAIGQNTALLACGAWIGGLALRSDVARMFNDAPDGHAKRPSRTTFADPKLAVVVRLLMEEEKVFLDPELTFANFVNRTGFGERAVRHHVLEELGYDHFRSFLNAQQVAEACRRLDDPTRHRGEKMIAIAFDSGFASLASFNRTFRSITGRTPTDYRRAREIAGNEERLASF